LQAKTIKWVIQAKTIKINKSKTESTLWIQSMASVLALLEQ
jgi:hypothetical protein